MPNMITLKEGLLNVAISAMSRKFKNFKRIPVYLIVLAIVFVGMPFGGGYSILGHGSLLKQIKAFCSQVCF